MAVVPRSTLPRGGSSTKGPSYRQILNRQLKTKRYKVKNASNIFFIGILQAIHNYSKIPAKLPAITSFFKVKAIELC